MKLIVVHDKNKSLLKHDLAKLDKLKNQIDEIITWDELVDKGLNEWCEKNSIKIKSYEASWQRLGRMAGLERNKFMVQYAESFFMSYCKDKAFFGLRKMAIDASLNIIK